MLRIGLTGGIGSGKSTVAHIFEVLGIPVYYADDAAKELMNSDAQLKSAIKKEFGDEIYKDGKLNRQSLAKVVFNDPVKLEILNSIVHPVTIRDADNWMSRQTTPYVIKEAALLFESGAAKHVDHVIGVYASEDLRIKRAMERDSISREEVIKRMNRQLDEDTKMKSCDFIINNDEQQLVIPQVLAIHKKLLLLAKH